MDSMEARDFDGVRAAQYVRMSTELQQYSTENQKNAIRQYADKQGIEIVRTYADEGKSGLTIERRPALNRLVDNILKGEIDFSLILVYDVSRWGRFQDIDEGAYYEFLCRKAGIGVEYCAEQFENDGSSISAILKSLKRVMASEYSRELSVRIFAGKRNVAARGYWVGSRAPYGLRRMLVDKNGKRKCILRDGEFKSISTERVILVPGPREEIAVIRWIFRAYLAELNATEIGRQLKARGVVASTGGRWSTWRVLKTLRNETYMGNAVWNRDSCKLRGKRRPNKPEDWVRAQGAFEPIISRRLFVEVQDKLAEKSIPYDRDIMLRGLRRLYRERGYLSHRLIDEDKRLPCALTFRAVFGSLPRAFQLAGFVSRVDPDTLDINRRLLERRRPFVVDVIDRIECAGGHVSIEANRKWHRINNETSISIRFLRFVRGYKGKPIWRFWIDVNNRPDFIVAARLDESNTRTSDFFLIPKHLLTRKCMCLYEANRPAIESCRFESLDPIISALTKGGLLESSNARLPDAIQ